MSATMSSRILLSLLILFVLIFNTAGETNAGDFTAFQSLTATWGNKPPNWKGYDPCGSAWDGIQCKNSRVTTITLLSMKLTGTLTGDIGGLPELTVLDLSYNEGLTGSLPSSIGDLKKLTNLILLGCSFTGPIPDTIGSLPLLLTLSLNSNSFNGPIPRTIGYLANLYWLDLAENQLTGTIPVSDETGPGLNMLPNLKHIHFGSNQLSGPIPPQLFSSKSILIHVLFERNNLSGPVPESLGQVKTLETLRLDGNVFNESVPSNLNNLTNVGELYLSNNKFSGPFPNLTGMNALTYVDMSNNSFTDSNALSSYSSLLSLTTLILENTQIQGQIPASLFNLPNLQTMVLSHNKLSGTVDISTTNSDQLVLINLQDNNISTFAARGGYGFEIILVGNPFCNDKNSDARYCTISDNNNNNTTDTVQPQNCVPIVCNSDRVSSPKCKCAYPYIGTLHFRATTFSAFRNTSYFTALEKSLMDSFQLHQNPVDSIFPYLRNPAKSSSEYLEIDVEFFPSDQDKFNRTGVSSIGNLFSSQTYKPPKEFGPFFFIGTSYGYFAESLPPVDTGSKKSSSIGIIIGAAAGGIVLVLLVLIAGVYAFRQKKIAEKATEQSHPFANWDTGKGSGAVPQLKGARWYSFEELKRCTNKFSEANSIGSGGYGKVYRGLLASGELIAIKRAQQGSMQGGVEFKTEIELLSRVHHKNLVSLYGFCFEQAEQMLVYEYVPNGTIRESLSGTSGIGLNWIRRLKIALDSARGVAYLHEFADPPIIHRDIKSSNILLDDRLTAKVADFGLSKLMNESGKGHVTTQVKGTMGYLDPEYYMTQQLTEKSDVYSFGVVMLELVTARKPIERGKYIVREVRMKMDRTKDLYNLEQTIDRSIVLGTLKGLEKFVDLALSCVEESAKDRPSMGMVVKEIENIMHFAGLNPNVESAFTSETYEGTSSLNPQHPYSLEAFEYSGGFPAPRIELM